jgi:hypothetical protein
MRALLPWILVAILLYKMLPSEDVLRGNDSELKMYRMTIKGLENQLGELGLQLREKDSQLTICKNSGRRS